MGNQSVKSPRTEERVHQGTKEGRQREWPSTRKEGVAYRLPQQSTSQALYDQSQGGEAQRYRGLAHIETDNLHQTLISEAALLQNQASTHADNAGNIQRITDELVNRHSGEIRSLQYTIDELTKKHGSEIGNLQSRIHELMGTFLSSVDTSGTTTRDDGYFQAEFTRLANEIGTIMLYLDGPDLVHKSPPLATREWLGSCSVGYGATEHKTVDYAEIEGAITEHLHERIFRSDFAFKVQGLADWGSLLGGTDLEKRRWHAQTVKLIAMSDSFKVKFEHEVDNILNELKDHLTHLVRPKDPDNFFHHLHQAVRNTAIVELDVSTQISQFESYKISPGAEFNEIFMDNPRWKYGKSTAGGRKGLLVQTVIIPPIRRRDFDSEGNFLSSWVAVHKGSVDTVGMS